jgi:hypothetical protein
MASETTATTPIDETTPVPIERVQLGVRIEKRMAKVLKGLAEFKGITLGELIEEIVLHSFEPVPGQEGQMTASAHSKRSLPAIASGSLPKSMRMR